ncbi:hypothetical protein KCU81_g223, partial [Aureobasidium melanogenum]
LKNRVIRVSSDIDPNEVHSSEASPRVSRRRLNSATMAALVAVALAAEVDEGRPLALPSELLGVRPLVLSNTTMIINLGADARDHFEDEALIIQHDLLERRKVLRMSGSLELRSRGQARGRGASRETFKLKLRLINVLLLTLLTMLLLSVLLLSVLLLSVLLLSVLLLSVLLLSSLLLSSLLFNIILYISATLAQSLGTRATGRRAIRFRRHCLERMEEIWIGGRGRRRRRSERSSKENQSNAVCSRSYELGLSIPAMIFYNAGVRSVSRLRGISINRTRKKQGGRARETRLSMHGHPARSATAHFLCWSCESNRKLWRDYRKIDTAGPGVRINDAPAYLGSNDETSDQRPQNGLAREAAESAETLRPAWPVWPAFVNVRLERSTPTRAMRVSELIRRKLNDLILQVRRDSVRSEVTKNNIRVRGMRDRVLELRDLLELKAGVQVEALAVTLKLLVVLNRASAFESSIVPSISGFGSIVFSAVRGLSAVVHVFDAISSTGPVLATRVQAVVPAGRKSFGVNLKLALDPLKATVNIRAHMRGQHRQRAVLLVLVLLRHCGVLITGRAPLVSSLPELLSRENIAHLLGFRQRDYRDLLPPRPQGLQRRAAPGLHPGGPRQVQSFALSSEQACGIQGLDTQTSSCRIESLPNVQVRSLKVDRQVCSSTTADRIERDWVRIAEGLSTLSDVIGECVRIQGLAEDGLIQLIISNGNVGKVTSKEILDGVVVKQNTSTESDNQQAMRDTEYELVGGG